MPTIPIAPLTKAAFAPFGEVIELDGAERIGINQGFAERVNGLARIEVATAGGSVNVSLFIARTRPRPIAIKLMERHPLGSQLFYPGQDAPWVTQVNVGHAGVVSDGRVEEIPVLNARWIVVVVARTRKRDAHQV